MTALEQFHQLSVTQPLGWTLLRFPWQGTGVAAPLAGVLQWLCRGNAPARYFAACAALG